jgi:biopolymer transport protein ExbB/biopolymer transport protein TolQ
MNGLVRAVVLVLTAQAVACIAVVIDRLVLLGTSERRSKKLARSLSNALERQDYGAALAETSAAKGSHLAQMIHAGLSIFLDRRAHGASPEKAAELTRRALDRKGESVSELLNKGMNVLASTGSTAPFVGLLGTVLGILNAFKQMAASGSGGIDSIGPAIAEALIVTGYGLVVAIPSVLVFNWLSGRIGHYENGLSNSASELVDRLEAGGALLSDEEEEEPVSAPGAIVSAI